MLLAGLLMGYAFIGRAFAYLSNLILFVLVIPFVNHHHAA
jgi:hypothetical protein